MKKIAISQSNYIPWKGYFDMIDSVDEFVLYDDMQYTRRDWRNRNRIKTPQGLKWLTVPVRVKGKYYQKIRDTEIDGDDWRQAHLRALELNYQKAPYFDEIIELVRPLYDESYSKLTDLNRAFIKMVCDYLGIDTKISGSWDYELVDGKTERLADICEQACASEYVSGPAAKDYMDMAVFEDKKIDVTWFNYSGYPEYEQLWGEFEHGVTMLDLMFNCGPQSREYMCRGSRS